MRAAEGGWGKLSRDATGAAEDWLPLEHHCIDVASVFRALCELPAIYRSLCAASGQDLSTRHLDRLAVFALLHDLGKCNHGFQAKADLDAHDTAGHVREVAPLFYDEELSASFARVIEIEVLASWLAEPQDVGPLLIASLSHHGRPVEFDSHNWQAYRRYWLPDEIRNPVGAISGLVQAAHDTFPDAFTEPGDPINASMGLQHRFAGLLMLADWLGSHSEGFFPFHHQASTRAVFAREAAAQALVTVGLDVGNAREHASQHADFAQVFGFPPSPLQEALAKPSNANVLIAESDTGSGKTEAALAHFLQSFIAGEVDSLYFALPTRVAARELYERVLAFARNVFGQAGPPVLLAVPGYSAVDGEPANALPDIRHLWNDAKQTVKRERAWAAERPKRFLAAPIAVGTIDQALLSSMQVNHAHLRSVCLDRSMLVVDEVHASDTYMQGLLRSLIFHHRRIGGRALLLSATLGADARSGLLTPPDRHHVTPAADESQALAYPSITTDTGDVMAIERGVEHREKTVHLQPTASLEDLTAVIPALREAASAGARVLVILNTVSRVIAFQKAVEQDSELAQVLFSCNEKTCPHHGRYARRDRECMDAAVSLAMGKKAELAPLVLIGSQTLEQSLDIDADWLITDLCPADVLLQRIGRLQRHVRHRPAGFERARCTVLMPEDPTMGKRFDHKGRVRPLAGLGNVYPDLRIARLTAELIGNGREIVIPRDNRFVVEATTHPDHTEQFRDGPWESHRNELLAIKVAHGQTADSALIPNQPFGELRFREFNEQVQTRLGMADRRIPLEMPLTSPFGQRLDEVFVPGWMVAPGVDADVLDGPPELEESGFRFRYGGRTYRYSRLGLERVDVA
ncbi:CRISPR-associated helicase Cas3' [Aquisalimonas asiatica]|uniref:CRISPR-associated helicase Cas3' n=1 Tax=Aquisalimonas asiatica TaxID=406100 RepID=UPI001FDF4703|nr:CRISPR-associated helicase Cas3' [Aquisalimonas asiatica]